MQKRKNVFVIDLNISNGNSDEFLLVILDKICTYVCMYILCKTPTTEYPQFYGRWHDACLVFIYSCSYCFCSQGDHNLPKQKKNSFLFEQTKHFLNNLQTNFYHIFAIFLCVGTNIHIQLTSGILTTNHLDTWI